MVDVLGRGRLFAKLSSWLKIASGAVDGGYVYQFHSENFHDLAREQLSLAAESLREGRLMDTISCQRSLVDILFSDYCLLHGFEYRNESFKPHPHHLKPDIFISGQSQFWYGHPLDTKTMHVPDRLRQAADIIKEHPPLFYERAYVMQPMRMHRAATATEEAVHGDDNAKQVGHIDYLLVAVQVSGRWYSVENTIGNISR